MQLTVLLAMISSMFQHVVPVAIARFGTTEIMMILLILFMLVIRIGIPIVVIFLLYQWWKNKKEKS